MHLFETCFNYYSYYDLSYLVGSMFYGCSVLFRNVKKTYLFSKDWLILKCDVKVLGADFKTNVCTQQ